MSDLSSIGRKHRPRTYCTYSFALLAAALLSNWITPAAHANSIIYATGVQVIGADKAIIDVRAQFDIDNAKQTVTISLLNLEANPGGITSVLGSLRFDISGAGTNPAPTITSYGFSTFDVDKNGNLITDASNPGDAWKASNIGGNTIALCTTCARGGNQELIIGGPAANGTYAAANGSIGPAHSPFIIGSNATYSTGVLAGLDTSPSWVLKLPGIAPGTTVAITDVTFGFGTGTQYGTDFYNMPLDTPEPESNIMVVTGLGLVFVSAAARRYFQSR